MLIYGHRGSSGAHPENTILAFREAIAAGADGVEIDIRITADGVPVVIHDGELSRTTNGTGEVANITLAELQRLDAGQGERVPTLDEVLELLGGRLAIDLELKQPGIERIVLETLERHPAASWFVSCFDWNVLLACRDLSPAAALWPLADFADDALFTIAGRLQAPGIALDHAAYTPEVADRCRRAKLDVGVWTVNDVAEGRRVRDLGASIIMTDYPAKMRDELGG